MVDDLLPEVGAGVREAGGRCGGEVQGGGAPAGGGAYSDMLLIYHLGRQGGGWSTLKKYVLCCTF